jgi:hypothetical protein
MQNMFFNAVQSVRSSLKYHGIDARRFVKSIFFLPRLFSDLRKYVALGGEVHGVLGIYNEDAGEGCSFSDYMILDHLVVQQLKQRNPLHHLDVGSRVDGLVLQASLLCSVTCMDVRPNPKLKDFGIGSLTADVCSKNIRSSLESESFESISSVHAIEHFGLGRYGDTINPSAVDNFLSNIHFLLKKHGTFYLGFPCGDNQIIYNAHRLMRPSFYLQKLNCMFMTEKVFLLTASVGESSSLWSESTYSIDEGEFQFDALCPSACLFVLRK